MTRAGVNRIGAVVPLFCSTLAFAIVIANIVAGVRPQPDENASAHLWQLLMAGQLPVVLLFLVTADWRSRTSWLVTGLQVFAMGMAAFPVWVAGY